MRLNIRHHRLALALFPMALAGSVAGTDPGDPRSEVISLTKFLDLNAGNFDAWRKHILPSADELRWQTIAWHASFSEGLVAADARQMPLLLWVMNGHPLGCT